VSGTNGSRPGVRFLRIALRYGRHVAEFELDAGERPFVIAGSNGSGKSSLMEAIVRTLYGFQRSRTDERAGHGSRRPWSGGAYEGRLTFKTARGIWEIERDFDTDAVRVTEAGRESPLFEGEAKPKGVGESARRFRALLEESLGVAELDPYARTACVFQGGLRTTSLNLDLLRVAAGGHTDVDTAHSRIQGEYRSLTVEPIDDGARRRRKLGSIERLEGVVTDLRSRAGAAAAVAERRGPLIANRDEARARLDALARDQAALERAFEVLSEARRLEEAAETSRARVRRLERTSRELDEALARFDLSRDRLERGPAPRYPIDFFERARVLEEGLWPRREALERERAEASAGAESTGTAALGLTIAGILALLLALVLWVAKAGTVGGPIAGVGGGILIASFVRRRADAKRRDERFDRLAAIEAGLQDVATRVQALVVGVPDADTLSPDSLSIRRAEFEREAADRTLIEESDRALRAALDLATRELVELSSRTGGEETWAPAAGGLTGRARTVLQALHDAAAVEREDVLAPLTVRLGELARSRFDLPAGADSSLDGVRDVRRRCLENAERERGELVGVERELALGTRGEESPHVLNRELAAASQTLDRQRARAEAYRQAFALVSEAYESFRRTDEERLVRAVSDHLMAVSGGDLGPLDASGGLESTQIFLGDRAVPISAPPMSYGQLHIALLSIRMGAADFLAGLGVRLPLLIDDPFVHLDQEAARELWEILVRVARERQVIVATQDRLLLSHLGVEPDLLLKPTGRLARPVGPTSADGGPPSPDEAERASPDAAGRPRPDVSEPDLWSQLNS